MAIAGVVGLGAVGMRVVQGLLALPAVDEVVVPATGTPGHQGRVDELGAGVRAVPDVLAAEVGPDVLVIAGPAGEHLEIARAAVVARVPVVSMSDRPSEVRALLELGARAARRGTWVVAGAGFSPGVSCVLAGWLTQRFDVVEQIHVAKDGTGGPACARQHHRALKSMSLDWRDGAWVRRAGGSGRELVWFPEPVAGADCYRASLADALVLQPVFPEVRRITGRLSATRQDRFTSWLPMLSPPHADGGTGAVRVEVRGRVDGAYDAAVAGAVARPSLGAAAMVSVVVERLLDGEASTAEGLMPPPGAFGVAKMPDAPAMLDGLRRRGVALQEYVGLAL